MPKRTITGFVQRIQQGYNSGTVEYLKRFRSGVETQPLLDVVADAILDARSELGEEDQPVPIVVTIWIGGGVDVEENGAGSK